MPFVPGYTHVPGHHCGSTALRNLLRFHGVEISEEMAFGLGAGACFYYVTIEGGSPSRFFNGRTARLEESFAELTGTALELRTFDAGGDEAWAAAQAEVDAGNPVLLLTDIYHLDHYGSSARFPGHAVVLAGYDERVAYLSDTAFEGLQKTGLENLEQARHGEHPAYQLDGHMFTVAGEVSPERLREAVPAAIARATRGMLEPEFPGFSGLDAVRRMAEEIGSWPEQADDWQWCARFGYQVIERRGTGGGAFRLMYSRFLEEVGRPAEAELAASAGAAWTALAGKLQLASESDDPDPGLWRAVDEMANAAASAEERLWASLDNP